MSILQKRASVLLILLICLLFFTQQVESTGKCVKFPTITFIDGFNGYNKPVCQNVLEKDGITHYWVDDEDLPTDLPDGLTSQDCYDSMTFKYDMRAADMVKSFEEDLPAQQCQNSILATFCYLAYRPCNPEIDITELSSSSRPCNWLCEFFNEEVTTLGTGVDGNVCTLEDLAWFNANNLPFVDLLPLAQEFKCNGPMYAPPDATECIAPKLIWKPRAVASRCEEYTGSFCSSVFSDVNQIYVPAGTDQLDMEAALLDASFAFNVLPTDNECSSAFVVLLCQSMFRECMDLGVKSAVQDTITGFENKTDTPRSTRVAYGLNPPLSTCNTFLNSCQNTPFFQSVFPGGDAIIDCQARNWNPSKCWIGNDTSTQRAVAQTTNSVWNFNTKSYFDEYESERWIMTLAAYPSRVLWGVNFAAEEMSVDAAAIPFVGCPEPTILSPSTGSTNIFRGRCALPCPLPMYTEAERRSITNAAWAFCIMSLVFSGLLSINFIIFKSQRHKTILFWYTLSFFAATVMLLLGLAVRRSGKDGWEMQCASATQYEHGEGWSLFQGMFLVYFLLVSMCWWNQQAVDLFQRLILGLQFRRGSSAHFKRNLAMHGFCWGMPLVCVIALIAGDQIGYDTYLPFSFIATDRLVTSHPMKLQYVFFFAPMIALAVISYILVAVVLIYLAKYDPTGGLKKFQDKIEKSKSFWFKFTQSLKLFGFSLLMVLFIVLLMIHFVYVASNQTDWDAALQEYAQGITIETLTGIPPVLTDRYDPALMIATIFGLCSPGFFMFILYFICSSEVYGLWAGLFYYKLGVTFFKSLAREDTSTGTGSNGSGSSHGSSTGKNTHSADLLTGGGEQPLTKRRGGDTQGSKTNDSSTEETPTHSNTKSPAPASSSGPSTSAKQQAKESAVRKSTLFKGFKANKIPVPSENRSRSVQPDQSCSGQTESIEMSYMDSQIQDTALVVVIDEEDHEENVHHSSSSQ